MVDWPHAPIHRFGNETTFFIIGATYLKHEPWCSASWFERTAPRGFVATVRSVKIDKVKVYDEF